MIFNKSIFTICSCLSLLLVNSSASYSMEERDPNERIINDSNENINEILDDAENNSNQTIKNYRIKCRTLLGELQLDNLRYDLTSQLKKYSNYTWYKDLLFYLDDIKNMLSDEGPKPTEVPLNLLYQYRRDIEFLPLLLQAHNINLDSTQQSLLKKVSSTVNKLYNEITPFCKSKINILDKEIDFDIKGNIKENIEFDENLDIINNLDNHVNNWNSSDFNIQDNVNNEGIINHNESLDLDNNIIQDNDEYNGNESINLDESLDNINNNRIIHNNNKNIKYNQRQNMVLKTEISKIEKIEINIQQEFVQYQDYKWFKQLLRIIDRTRRLKTNRTTMLQGYDNDAISISATPSAVLRNYIQTLALLPITLSIHGIKLTNQQKTIIKDLQDSISRILQSLVEKVQSNPKNFNIDGTYNDYEEEEEEYINIEPNGAE